MGEYDNEYNQNKTDPGFDDYLAPEATVEGLAGAEVDPTVEKYKNAETQAKWKKELEAARSEYKPFIDKGNKIIARYSDERESGSKRKNFNVFFVNTDLKQSAMLGQVPSPDISRRFHDANDDVSRVASTILTRVIVTESDLFDLIQTLKPIVFDRLVPGIGIGWARFEEAKSEPTVATQTDPLTGLAIQVPVPPQVTHQLSDIDYVAWDDFLWSPCRTWKLCRWVARRLPMTKADIEARFAGKTPEQTLANLSYEKAKPEDSNSTKVKPENETESTVDVWEIWDKTCGHVFWIAESADVPLDVALDTNDFPGFFPTPMPPLARVTTSNTKPIADYTLVQDLYLELDDLNNRAATLVNNLRLRFVYDQANSELKELYTTTADNEGIPVKNWSSFQEKGGLTRAMEFAPLNEIRETYQSLIAARSDVRAQIEYMEGLSADLFQGRSAHNETQLATSQKSAFGTSRLAQQQFELAKYVEGLLRLKAQLICKFYTPETIIQRIGTLPQADQQFIQPAIQLLRDQQMRGFKLNVSVDALQSPNWNLERAERTETMNVVLGGMQKIFPMVKETPALTPVLIEMFKWSISGFKGVQEIEGELDRMAQEFQAAQQASAGQPPQPSKEQIEADAKKYKADIDLQIAKMENDRKTMEGKVQAQMDMVTVQMKKIEGQIRAQLEASKVQVAQQKNQVELVKATVPDPGVA